MKTGKRRAMDRGAKVNRGRVAGGTSRRSRTFVDSPRVASVSRRTRETEVNVRVNVDGRGEHNVQTGVPFLDHMLETLARHGLFDLGITATGDLAVDAHHTVEDVGLTLGQALREALGDKAGICRFGEASVPLDEAMVKVVVDLSGRPYLVYDVDLGHARIGDFDVQLVRDYMQALATQLAMNLHVSCERGRNPHHVVEAAFKALARALDAATRRDPRVCGVPSTKGSL